MKVEDAAKRICRATGLDWDTIPDVASSDVVEDKAWFRRLAAAALATPTPVADGLEVVGHKHGYLYDEPLVRQSEAVAIIQRLTEENEELRKDRNENAKLKGQRDAALARIKQMQDSNSRMAGEWSSLKDHIKALEKVRAEITDEAGSAMREQVIAALTPLAAIADGYDDDEDDDFQVWKDFDILGAHLPLKYFREARAALSALESEVG